MSTKPVYVLAAVLVAVFAGVVGYGQYVKYNDPLQVLIRKMNEKTKKLEKINDDCAAGDADACAEANQIFTEYLMSK